MRTEKERLAAEKEARDKAQQDAAAESERRRREQDELDRYVSTSNCTAANAAARDLNRTSCLLGLSMAGLI